MYGLQETKPGRTNQGLNTKKTKALKIVRNKNTAKELSEKLKKRIYTLRKERLLKTPVKNDIETAKRQSIKDLSIKATIRKYH